jgi:predicted ATP-binding protein involved in virulence
VDIKLGGTDRKYHQLVQSVFDIIGKVAEGMKLTYKGVDANKRIQIETEDGTLIPLEALSQGTISLIGWIGILMQRLYQVFGQDEDPRLRYALILMDEIDAHMHPLWQRTLVSNLSEAFPNAQFIASTHSPLVVGGMPARQVVRFARDKSGAAVILPIAPDMTLGYTDQVLTSLLFGVPPSLDRHTEIMKKRFDELDSMNELNDDEQAEHEQLKQELIARIPGPSATYDEKHRNQKEEAEDLLKLGLKLSKRVPEEGKILINRANKLFDTIGEKPNP